MIASKKLKKDSKLEFNYFKDNFKFLKNKFGNPYKIHKLKKIKFIYKLYKKKIKLKKPKFKFKKFKKKKWWYNKKTRRKQRNKPRLVLNSEFSKLKINKYSTYLNLHVIHQDLSIQSFINTVLLKNGEKSKYFNIFLKTLTYLKEVTGISPLRIIKALLKPERLLLVHLTKSQGRRIFNVPKMIYRKIRYGKFLFFLKNNIKTLQIEKFFTLEQKLAYIILNELLSKNKEWADLIKTNADLVYKNKRFLFSKKY